MKKKITLITTGFFLGLLSLQAQTTCSDDRVAYVNSKNTGSTGAYNLSVGAEEKASQAYHYSGPGKVGGARVYGSVPHISSVLLKVSLYNVDANGRPSGSALSSAPLKAMYSWSPSYFDVSFSPAVSVSANFALVVEVVNMPGWGHDFALRYTGNGEGLGEDLASIAGTSTGSNWASAMTTFSKDGDFYIYPKMKNFNTPMFSVASECIATGGSVSFTNATQMTVDPMFNAIAAQGYAGEDNLYSWDFGDGSPVSHQENPSHTYATAGSYNVTLTSMIDGWDGNCSKTYSKIISVGLTANATSIVNVTCNGSSNGSVLAVGSQGASPYTYSINEDSYQSSASFNNLSAGTHTLYVKDAIGCVQSKDITITQPTAIQFSSATSTNASCGNSDGGLLVATTGGVSAMQYQLNSGQFQSSGAFTNLSANAYTITAKDGNACTNSTIVVVNDLGGPALGYVNSTNVSCFGGNDGSISLTSIGGTGVLHYSINGGNSLQTTGVFNNVAAGNYTVMVKDAAGCTDVQLATIGQAQHLILSASATPVSCFGGANGQIKVTSASGGTGNIVYSLNGISFQSGTTFSDLAAGAYTVYVKDVAGCLNSVSVNVTQPTALSANVLVSNNSCNGYQDGTITITGTGGTQGYTYGVGDDNEYQSSGVFAELAAGSYSMVVNDANGCAFTAVANITQPTVIVPVATTTNSTCSNSNGGILVVASGGSGSGYTYSIDGGSYGAGSFSGLAAGTYVVIAKDGTGCTSVLNVTIFDSNGPSIVSNNHTNVSCNGGNDGSISIVSVVGGTGALEYSINGTTYQNSTMFSRLPAGIYNVTVKDAVGCIGSVSDTLHQPNAFVINTTADDATCNGGHSGSITLQVGGGAGTLAYSINQGLVYQSSNVFNNLAAGNYPLLVKDAGGCLGYVNATVAQPTAISASFSALNVSCAGNDNGALNITASGGTGALQYSLNASSFQSSSIFSGLAGGNYSVSIKDANNCVALIPASVFEPIALTLNSNVSNVSCAGGNNGVIDLSVSGGNTPYDFNWSNEVNSEDNFNLVAGAYDVVVSDENGCTVSKSFTITQPAAPVVINGVVVNSTGTNDGSVDITVTGGTGSYSYLWSNNNTNEDISALNSGSYSVIVSDDNGCASTSTFVVTNSLGVTSTNAVNNEVSVYPNPANDRASVQANGAIIDRIELTNILGQVIYSSQPQISKVDINTSELQQGVYFVRILVEGKMITRKLEIVK